MKDRIEFERHVREVLANLYDYAALEMHPLASYLRTSSQQPVSRGEQLRRLVLQIIDNLQPPDKIPSPTSIEWRPYFILKERYIEGYSLEELQTHLSLSERQLRREHGRALQAVASLLWNQLFPGDEVSENQEAPVTSSEKQDDDFAEYKITQESLDLTEVVAGVADIFRRRVQHTNIELHLNLPPNLSPILTDRVILRQILLSLFSYIFQGQLGQVIRVGAEVGQEQVRLSIQGERYAEGMLAGEAEKEASLDFARYWGRRLGLTLQENAAPDQAGVLTRLILSLPRADQEVVMVVDDQETTMRMFRRYLSRTSFKIVEITDPGQALLLARQLHPVAITLDVMMPTMDGWEILQALQADPETQHIPVIVCSVWNEPELASSLGAATFLKKPIMQKDLLDALARLKPPK